MIEMVPFFKMPWAMQTQGLGAWPRLVYAVLIDGMRGGTTVSIGNRELARLLSTTQSTILRAAAQIERGGFLQMRRRGRGQRMIYSLPPAAEGAPPEVNANRVQSDSGSRALSEGEVIQEVRADRVQTDSQSDSESHAEVTANRGHDQTRNQMKKPDHGADGACAGSGGGNGRVPHIEPADLDNFDRLVALCQRCILTGAISASEADRVWFFTAVEHARRCGDHNPAGLFASMLRQPEKFRAYLTVGDEEAARARAAEWRAGQVA